MALQTKSISANGSKGHHKFTLNISEDSTNVANNNSAISWTFVLSPIANGWDWYYSSTKPVEYTITVNGAVTTGVIYEYNGSSTVTIKSGSATIPHNADGSKSISFSFSVTSLNQSFLPGSASANDTMALTSIPRAATIVSAPNFSDGVNPTITYSNPAGNAVTSLKACISYTGADDIPYRDIPKTGSSYTFNLTAAERATLYAGVKTGNSVSVKFYVTTVIGGQTYYSTLTRTFSLTNTALPTINPTLVDTNPQTKKMTGDDTRFIRYMSEVSFTTGASAKQGATITSQSVTNGSQTLMNSSSGIMGIEEDTFRFQVTDSRGNTATKNVTVDMVPYTKLTCHLKVTPPTASGRVSLSVSGNYWLGVFDRDTNVNNIEAVVYCRMADTTDWTYIIPLDSNTFTFENDTYSLNNYTLASFFDYTQLYEFQLVVKDSLMEVESPIIRVTGKPIFDWGSEDFRFNVDVHLDKEKGIYGTNGDGEAVKLVSCGTNGDLMLGEGQYQNGNTTHIFGKSISLMAEDGVLVNGVPLTGGQKVLWSGGLHMGNGANAGLSETISSQQNGVVLVFSLYRNNVVEDVSFNSFFVSKQEVALMAGKPHTFIMGINAGFSTIAAKYIYIYDNALLGDASNTSSGSNSGITFNNSMFVLRYVIGV